MEDKDETINENKAKLGVHAFVVDKNIFENYSAYRLNNNMGIGGGHGPSKKRMVILSYEKVLRAFLGL